MTASAADIDAAVAALRAGELVAFPTETVYGLGADASNPEALRNVFALKGRPATHPLILHLPSVACLSEWAIDVPPHALRLAARFWPGPLTLVLRRAAHVSPVLTGGQDTLAVRVPAHPVALALLAAFGGGIAAPSANRYGRVSPTRAEHVREEFPEGLLVLEGGDCEFGVESTIVSLVGDAPQLLRPGAISREEIEKVLGLTLQAAAPGSAPRVPGSTRQHYAPRTPVELVSRGQMQLALEQAAARGEKVLGLPCPEGTTVARYSRALYAELRRLDKQGAERILVESVPLESVWDAVRDRLARAAATFS